jgi:transposase InsO family protein
MFSNASSLMEPFDCNGSNLGVAWTEWQRRLEQLFLANEIKRDKSEQRINTLFFLGGTELCKTHDTLPDVEWPVTNPVTTYTDYEKAIFRLNAYYNPQRNTVVEKFLFNEAAQNSDETIAKYVTRLRILGKYCSFANLDDEIVRQVIQKCSSSTLRRTFLKQQTITISKLLELGKVHDTLDSQVEIVEGKKAAPEPDRVNFVNKQHGKKRFQSNKAKASTGTAQSTSSEKRNLKCYRCDGVFPHPKRESCPALGQTCSACNKPNHFAKCCRANNKGNDMINQIESIEAESKEDQAYIFSIGQGEIPTTIVKMNGVELSFNIDTGAAINILDEEGYNALKPRPKLTPSVRHSFGYSSTTPLPMIGRFTTSVSCNNMVVEAEFNVVKGNHGRLLSYKTCTALKLVHIVNTVGEQPKQKETVDPKLAKWIEEFPTVFTDKVGVMKDFELQLHIDKSVKPVQARPRNKPFHLVQIIDEQIKKKLASGVIEEVVGEPTEWLSETVLVPKGDSNELRLCTDMREANTAIIRENHEMPNLETLLYGANGMKHGAKLDLNSAFEQIRLKKECRYISRFRTHNAIYQHTTLFFGISSAPEIFHNLIRKILAGIEGVVNATDDIFVTGNTEEQLESRFREVLKRLKHHGFTVKVKKCVYNESEITFFGLKLSAHGASLSDQKTAALKNFKTPSDKSELHSFLALANYASRWIPKFSDLSKELWELTHDDVEFVWDKKQQERVDLIKHAMIQVVGFFDIHWNTSLTTDASPVGLSGILTQENPADPSDRRVITHVSRMLSDTETRYAQIEKEALACVWACERLQLYLLGNKFDLYTDNKAVSLIYNNPLSKPPARILRWHLKMSPFKFTIKHIPGRGNMSDFLSRHPMALTATDKVENENFINSIVHYTIPTRVSKQELLSVLKTDKQMEKLSKMIKESLFDNKDPDVQAFSQVFNELSLTAEGFILRHDQLLIPSSLQNRVVELAHQSHLGIVRIKRLIRSKVWFPGIDKMVDNKVKSCMACQAAERSGTNPAPLHMSTLPRAPWVELSIDFFGPIAPTREYLLVLLDDYSRFVLVEIMFSTTAEVVIRHLEHIFSLFGNPETLKSDNGPPFQSNDFANYARQTGFKHRLITPLWPMANGMDESIMKTMAKVIRTAKIDGVPWKVRLTEYLRQYRSTPHSSTGVAPATLLFRNSDPSRLLCYKTYFREQAVDRKAKAHDKARKEKMKLAGDKRLHVKPVSFVVGDMVLVKQNRTNKSMSHFEAHPYRITMIKGNMITATADGRTRTRNVSFFKKWRGDFQPEVGKPVTETTVAPIQGPTQVGISFKRPKSNEGSSSDNDTSKVATIEDTISENDTDSDGHDKFDDALVANLFDENVQQADRIATEHENIQEDELTREQVQEVEAVSVVQAAVRVFEANDDGKPKSPVQGTGRESRTTRNQAPIYRDTRAYNKQPQEPP